MQQRRRLSATRSRPALALVLSTVLIATAAIGIGGERILSTQQAGGDPVSAYEENISFASGENVVVEDAAISAQGGEGERTVREFTSDQQFSMFALTWQGERDIAAFVRAQAEDGSWGPWYDAEPLGEINPDGKNGTELVYVEPTNRVQVSVTGIDLFSDEAAAEAELGDAPGEQAPAAEEPAAEVPAPAPAEQAPADPAPAAEAPGEQAPANEAPAVPADPARENTGGAAPLPSNYGAIQPVNDVVDPNSVEVVFIDGNAGEGGIALANDSTTVGMPDVISRAGWGADESKRCSTPTIDNSISAVTIHHTAGSNNYSEAESAARMRGYYTYHASTLGWCDIGYNALVDKYGNIYEGRAGGLNKAVRGAHAGGFNQNTWGISMMGNYEQVSPSAETIQAVGELAGWRASLAGFDPKGTDTHYSEGTSFTKYPRGTSVNLPNIFAHRDVGNTSCPGNAGYAQMDNIRDIAAATYASINSGDASDNNLPPTNPGDPNPGGQNPGGQNQSGGAIDGTQASSETNTGAGAGLDLAGLLAGDSEAVVSAIGTIAMLALTLAQNNGEVTGQTSTVGDAEVIQGLSLSDIPPVADGLVSLSGDNQISEAWRQISASLGPVLGESRGGIAYAGDRGDNTNTSYALFDNGIILSSDQTGPHALWGAIGDIWAGTGMDLGPLGLPVNEEYRDGDLLRVDFQNGSISYNPTSGESDVQLN